eukprot:7415541-Ditylum_brightwellii.AAC.1
MIEKGEPIGNDFQDVLIRLAKANGVHQSGHFGPFCCWNGEHLFNGSSLFSGHSCCHFIKRQVRGNRLRMLTSLSRKALSSNKERTNMERECEFKQEISGAAQNLFKKVGEALGIHSSSAAL